MATKQKKNPEVVTTEKNVLCSMERIISASKYEKKSGRGRNETFYKYNDLLMETVESDASYLAEQYHITPKQAVLFTIILGIGMGESVRLTTLFDTTELSLTEYLTVKADLRALEVAMLIRNDSGDRYIIPHEVNDLLVKNLPYIKPEASNLSTANIMTRMSRLFKNLGNSEGNSIIYMHQIDEMVLANPETSIAKAADKYGILKAGSKKLYYYDGGENDRCDYLDSMLPAERMLFYVLCYRYDRHDDDFVNWSDVADYYDEKVIDFLRDTYREEELYLQKKANAKDHYKLQQYYQ